MLYFQSAVLTPTCSLPQSRAFQLVTKVDIGFLRTHAQFHPLLPGPLLIMKYHPSCVWHTALPVLRMACRQMSGVRKNGSVTP